MTVQESKNQKDLIKKSISFAVLLSSISIFLNFFVYSNFLTLFILFFIVERVYESYFTLKKPPLLSTQDRPLRWVIIAFSVMVSIAILEFYLSHKHTNWYLSSLGFGLLALSLILRWSAIKTIDEDWSIDTFGIPQSIQRKSPYSYLRHPYYVGVFLEAISFPLVLNTWRALAFSAFVVVPLEGYRAFLEEKILTKNFGWSYIRFKKEVNQFLPTFEKRECYDRRENSKQINDSPRSGTERRNREETPPGKDRRKIIRH